MNHNYFFLKPEEISVVVEPERYIFRIRRPWSKSQSGLEPAIIDSSYISSAFQTLPEEFRKIALKISLYSESGDAYEIITKYHFTINELWHVILSGKEKDIKGLGQSNKQQRIFKSKLKVVPEEQIYHFFSEIWQKGYFDAYLSAVTQSMGCEYLKGNDDIEKRIRKLLR